MNPVSDLQLPHSLPCSLLPLQHGGLLFPNANVEEVTIASHLTPLAASEAFVLGSISWHEQTVPVISFEGLCDGAVPADLALRRVAIVKGLQGEALPYYGIAVAAIPRVLHLAAQVLRPLQEAPLPGCFCQVTLAGRSMMLPDCDEIERRILAALPRGLN